MMRSPVTKFLALALTCVCGHAFADVVLHPGTLTGTVGLTGATVNGGSVSLYGNANGFSGSTSFAGNTFSLTVEGDQTYQTIGANESFGTGYFSMYVYNQGYTVPAGGSLAVDLTRPGGSIAFEAIVTGGTTASETVYAASSTTNETDYAYGFGSGGNEASFPMIAASNIAVYGTLTISVLDADGAYLCTTQKPIPTQTVSVTEASTTLVQTSLTVSPTDCSTEIFGVLAVNNLPDGIGPDTSWVYASGPTWAITSFRGNNQSYSLTGLAPGNYWTQGYSFFAAPYSSWLYPPGVPVTLAQGDTHELDWVNDGVDASGHVNTTGSWAGKPLYGAMSMSATTGPYAYTSITNGDYRAVVTPGDWAATYLYLAFYDSTAGVTSYAQLSDGSAPRTTFSTGTSGQFAAKDVATSQGQVVFDVIEPPGSPTIGISNATVYANRYDSTTNQYVAVQAYSYGQNIATPAVQIVGPPGTYQFDAWGTVEGTWTRFASSTLDLGQSVNTPTGSDVTIVPEDSAGNATPVTLDFSSVTGGGETTATITDVGPAGPADYLMLKAFGNNTYIDISTTATYSGKIEVCLHYDPVALGLTPQQETKLVLQHYVCTSATSCTWTKTNEVYNPHNPPYTDADPTYFGRTGGPAVDTTTHTICGVTSSLSPFALTMPSVVLVPPSDSCIGSAGAAAQITTDPGACSAAVDNVNQVAGGCSGGGGGLLSCTYDGAPQETVGLGDHAITIVGTANDLSTSTCTSYVDVVDREPPRITCPPAVSVECTGAQTSYTVTASALDNCATSSVSCGQNAFPLGTTTVACNASDASGNAASCATTVQVVDTAAPSLSVSASPTVLYPPNHKMVPITLKTPVTDTCDGHPAVTCTAESNEPVTGGGSGNTMYDILWKDGQLLLRSERAGTLSDRIYTITCTAKDASGNATTVKTQVVVPHD